MTPIVTNRALHILAGLLAVLSVSAGCGSSFERSGSEAVVPATAEVGSGLRGPTPSAGPAADAGAGTTEASEGAPAAPGASAVAAPIEPVAPQPGQPRNQTVTLHEGSGLRLTFVVGDRLEFSPGETIDLELTIRNTSTTTRWIDSNSPVHFALWRPGATDPAWTDRSCFVGYDFEDHRTSGIALAGGEEMRFSHRYPDGGYQTQAEPPECRVPAGIYLAGGQASWCPDEALEPTGHEGATSYSCNPAEVVGVVSRPLQITIG